jgi:hypothetical protein
MLRTLVKFPLLLMLCFLGAFPAHGADKQQQQFKLGVPKPGKKGNIFNLFFGSPPPMPTDRGTLIINAFLDSNGNKRRDHGERDLRKEISCRVDGIDYTVPAFIPGLDYNGSFKVVCTGSAYHPIKATRDILIAERGQVIRIDLPCVQTQEKTAGPAPKGKKEK